MEPMTSQTDGVPAAGDSALLDTAVDAYEFDGSRYDAFVAGWRAGRAVSAPPPVPEALCVAVVGEASGNAGGTLSYCGQQRSHPDHNISAEDSSATRHAFVPAPPPVAPATDRLAAAWARHDSYVEHAHAVHLSNIDALPGDVHDTTECDALAISSRADVESAVRAASPVALQQDEIAMRGATIRLSVAEWEALLRREKVTIVDLPVTIEPPQYEGS